MGADMSTEALLTGSRVLITGASGMLGSAFLRAVVGRAQYVRAVRHRRPIEINGVEVVEADLLTREGCARVCHGMDVVIHAAAETGGSRQVTVAGREMFTRSLLMNTLVLDEAHAAGAGHLLFLSNTSVYAPSSDPLDEDDAWGETCRGIPENETGMVKRVGETQCQLYARTSSMRIAIIRAANAYGPGDNFDLTSSHVVPALVRRAVEGQDPLPAWGDGSTVRDFIHVDDIATAGLQLLASAGARGCQPVNVGTGITVTVRELLQMILEESGTSGARVVWSGESPPASAVKRLDLTRMRALGIAPAIPLRQGLASTIEWYRAQRR
jgi:GDP-L-fucose synthase